jgi:predicted SAM-dependent methyltransferase
MMERPNDKKGFNILVFTMLKNIVFEKLICFLKINENIVNRITLGNIYIRGSGIEIGALHNPLTIPKNVHVSYVDKCNTDGLRKIYPELNNKKLVDVDIVDDAEILSTIKSESQDFVIANHLLEHCENPIKSIQTFIRVLKIGGILYMAVPDKRYTFDKNRPVTDISHIIKDYNEGSEQSRIDHYYEYASLVDKSDNVIEHAKKLMDANYSIHFHTWTQTEILELLVYLKHNLKMSFEVIDFCARNEECICIIKKCEY